jgi:hypothetical protein
VGRPTRWVQRRGVDEAQQLTTDAEARLVVLMDGPELYAWNGGDGEARWRWMAPMRLGAVGVSDDGVWALDEEGTLFELRRDDGVLLRRSRPLASAGRTLAVAGRCVVVGSADEVRVLDGHAPRCTIAITDVVDVALDASGRHLAAVDEGGTLTSVRLEDGLEAVSEARVRVGGRPSRVVTRPDGGWTTLVGHRVRLWDAGLTTAAQAWASLPEDVLDVASVEGGAGWALATGPREILLLGGNGRDQLGSVRLGRPLVGVAGGARGVVFFAVDGADVLRVDLHTGRHRPVGVHVGRARVPWSADVDIAPGRFRGAVASHRTGGGPIAVAPPPLEVAGGWRKTAWWAAITTGVVFVCLAIVFATLRASGVI